MRRSISPVDRFHRPPRHHHGRKHAHAQKALKLLETNIGEAIKSVTNFKVTNDRETIALLSQVNIFSHDMQRVVYNLQKIVIWSFDGQTEDPELADAVKKFSQFAYSIQQCSSDDPEVLKNQLKENLEKIMPQARGLVASVQRNVNHEYIHEVVNAVDDILFGVQKIELRNNLENDTYDDLITNIRKIKDDFTVKLNSFDHTNLSVLRDLKHAVRYGKQKMFEIIRLIDTTADNYNEEIKNILLETTYKFNRVIADIDSSTRLKSDVTLLKYSIIIASNTVLVDLEDIIKLLQINIADAEGANNLHNLVIIFLDQVVALGSQLIRLLELASDQTSDD